jgi:hypothetical protein
MSDDILSFSNDGNLPNPSPVKIGGSKVKCTEADTADYLNTKINIDQSIASLITLEKQDNQILIKSALESSGLLAVTNGVITPISTPTSGQFLLSYKNGSFSWIEYSDCENACEHNEV